jgi:hypothetical protein
MKYARALSTTYSCNGHKTVVEHLELVWLHDKAYLR